MLYHLAVETGFRAGEIRHLTPIAFDLVDDAGKLHPDPTITIAAAYSKRRREDVQPIRREFAAALMKFLKGKDSSAPVFGLPKGYHLSKIIRRDLEAARGAWIDEAPTATERHHRGQSDFLMYTDHAGRKADFHSLRHTYITNLARGGVHPKVAQTLARHSTITLTMDLYSHTVREDQRDALQALPDLGGDKQAPERLRATGTDARLPLCLPKNLPTPVASKDTPIASRCTEGEVTRDRHIPEPPENIGKSCTSLHAVASDCSTGVDGNRTHQGRRKPPLNGFEGRGTHQASGHSQSCVVSHTRGHLPRSTCGRQKPVALPPAGKR